ncbi:hypothetical protein ACSBR1_014955 [Camellia fascicularis]
MSTRNISSGTSYHSRHVLTVSNIVDRYYSLMPLSSKGGSKGFCLLPLRKMETQVRYNLHTNNKMQYPKHAHPINENHILQYHLYITI